MLIALRVRSKDDDTSKKNKDDERPLQYIVNCHLQGKPQLVDVRFSQIKSVLRRLELRIQSQVCNKIHN